jgi:hypothetical protein
MATPKKPSEPNLAPLIRLLPLSDSPRYHRALGGFIERFAYLEGILFAYLLARARLPAHIGRAILSGGTIDTMTQNIIRLWDVEPLPKETRTEMNEVFEHLKNISTAHYGSFMLSKRQRVSSNVLKALTTDRILQHRVSPRILSAMNIDLLKIGLHVISTLPDQSLSLAERAKTTPALASAWRYTHPSGQRRKSRKPKRKRHKKEQVRSGQPAPSRA